MRSLAIYLRNYKKESILAPFFKFLEVVFDLLVPVVIAQIIDVGIIGNDRLYIIERFLRSSTLLGAIIELVNLPPIVVVIPDMVTPSE